MLTRTRGRGGVAVATDVGLGSFVLSGLSGRLTHWSCGASLSTENDHENGTDHSFSLSRPQVAVHGIPTALHNAFNVT
jgi:hypothetical protein